MNACPPVLSSKIYIYKKKKKEKRKKKDRRGKTRKKEKTKPRSRGPENLFVHGIIEWKPIESTIVRPRYYNPCANNPEKKKNPSYLS